MEMKKCYMEVFKMIYFNWLTISLNFFFFYIYFFLPPLTYQEHQMSEMMKNSGDSSNRLSLLNDQVQEKNRSVYV